MEEWGEARAVLEPMFDRVFSGDAVSMEGFSLELDRHRKIEKAHFDFSYSPVCADDGPVQGLFGACIETTARVQAERRQASATERQRRHTSSKPQGSSASSAVPNTSSSSSTRPTNGFSTGDDWIGQPVREAFPDIAGQGFYELLDQVYQTGERVDLHRSPGALPN